MLEHGGRLIAASNQYNIPLAQWVDLSTGINPQPYVPPPLPLSAWQRLPEDDDGLIPTARTYYGNSHLLAVAGSQAAIQTLPSLFAAKRVAVVSPTYSEHPAAWAAHGHIIVASTTLEEAVTAADIVVLCNPNNPTGHALPHAAIIEAAVMLSRRGGWLIVDEAFIDATPQYSVTAEAGGTEANLIVLRSLGKFFGLAGARVGFVVAAPAILDPLRDKLGPWPIAHPSRIVVTAALKDLAWQQTVRQTLLASADRLESLLTTIGHVSGCALFQYLAGVNAAALHTHMAQRGILTRLFTHPPALRFGLPATEAEWQRLSQALAEWRPE